MRLLRAATAAPRWLAASRSLHPHSLAFARLLPVARPKTALGRTWTAASNSPSLTFLASRSTPASRVLGRLVTRARSVRRPSLRNRPLPVMPRAAGARRLRHLRSRPLRARPLRFAQPSRTRSPAPPPPIRRRRPARCCVGTVRLRRLRLGPRSRRVAPENEGVKASCRPAALTPSPSGAWEIGSEGRGATGSGLGACAGSSL